MPRAPTSCKSFHHETGRWGGRICVLTQAGSCGPCLSLETHMNQAVQQVTCQPKHLLADDKDF